jgi:prepilin signal peptidase PulO-like enzyme (type II secretory pathway)
VPLLAGLTVFLLGLAVGSFLNVVIYRLPRELSLAKPRRSFCPACRQPIAWRDNLPILSWLLLRGRCRRCAAPISVQYPLVEAATALSFLLCYYLLFAQQARWGCSSAKLPVDLPLLAAFLLLSACMIACAAMDLVSYAVDVRITWVGMAGGVICYAFWPRAGFLLETATMPLAPGAVACLLVSGLWLWLTFRRYADDLLCCDEPTCPSRTNQPAAQAEPSDSAPTRTAGDDPHRTAFAAGVVAVVALVGICCWLLAGLVAPCREPARPGGPLSAAATCRLVVPVALSALFAVIVLAGGQPRHADVQIHSAIEHEQPQARRTVLRELCWLALPAVAGAGGYALVRWAPGAGAAWQRLLDWSPGGGFFPAAGATYAIFGLTAGAAAGWLLRIVFTLVFGREALGLGDIYILAVAGATGGWDIALLGLLLAVGIALAGYLVGLLLKRTVIIPFGPWLGLGFLCALWLNRPAARLAADYLEAIRFTWTRRPDMCVLSAGILLVGAAGAIALARLFRRVVETSSD